MIKNIKHPLNPNGSCKQYIFVDSYFIYFIMIYVARLHEN